MNADSRAKLTASRKRIVIAADEARRQIQRNLHDSTQQRLVSLALQLRSAQAMAVDNQALSCELDRIVGHA